MNRKNQIEERSRPDGQAVWLSNLQITERYRNPDYQIFRHDLTRGETGHLRVFSLIPIAAGKPSFEARIDDGNPGKRKKEPELDFDINGVSKRIRRAFRANRNGYIGHHTNRSPNPNHRIFDVEIVTPAGKVFEGEVSFNTAFSVGAVASVSSNVTASAVVIEAPRITKVRNLLWVLYDRVRACFPSLFH